MNEERNGVNAPSQVRQSVQDYYGKVLKSKNDLKAGVCCPVDSVPEHLRPYLRQIHEEIQERFYGCGAPVPPVLAGKTILDLGCGTGRDAYVFSQLVGPEGRVIGVDMTEEQLALAKKYLDYHTRKFGLAQANVEFRQGYIEDLAAAGVADAAVDVVVSNCVFNLSPDKERLFAEVFRVLKPGGELYFSDVFAGRRLPEACRTDPEMVGECLGGALYTQDFRRILRDNGIHDHRVLSKTRLALNNPDIQRKAGMIDFYSMTVRTFKCDFEDICENYGHVAFYRGTIPEYPHAYALDDHHVFTKGLPLPICGNTAKMIQETRYREHFQVIGDFSTHYGAFDCAPMPGAQPQSADGACC